MRLNKKTVKSFICKFIVYEFIAIGLTFIVHYFAIDYFTECVPQANDTCIVKEYVSEFFVSFVGTFIILSITAFLLARRGKK